MFLLEHSSEAPELGIRSEVEYRLYFDFLRGRNLDTNRALLLRTNYAIIADILGIKGSDGVKEKNPPPVSGEPIEAYTKIILDAANRFQAVNNQDALTFFKFHVDRVILSNTTEDNKDTAFRPLCCFLGGILGFFNEATIEYNDALLSFIYDEPDPFDYSNFIAVCDRIRCTGKWGDPCKIQFRVTVGNEERSKIYDYKWVFSPYCAWNNAFLYLDSVLYAAGDSYAIPTMAVCDNIQD